MAEGYERLDSIVAAMEAAKETAQANEALTRLIRYLCEQEMPYTREQAECALAGYLARIAELERANAAAMAVVRDVEENGGIAATEERYYCIYCGVNMPRTVVLTSIMDGRGNPVEQGHAPDCPVIQARALLAAETGAATREETEE